jgi:hypothetical protein
MPSDLPYLSVVVAARNDTHGGNFLRRFQVFIRGLLEQANRYKLALELIIVEWNPPPDRPRLSKALTWPKVPRTVSVRIITVPTEIHKRFRYSDKLPMYEMIAKNVGIRRARGFFILATNGDLLFSNELIEFLASRRLMSQFIYRIDRDDVRGNVPVRATVDAQIEYCKRHVTYVYARYGTFVVKNGLDSKALRRSDSKSRFCVPIPPRLYFALHHQRQRFRERTINDGDGKSWNARCAKELKKHFRRPFPLLHPGAPGDFTLLGKQQWFALRGYPELEVHSYHLDSIFCHIAHHAGIGEFVLQDPMRIYHQEHPPGHISDWQRKKNNDALGIPMMMGDQYERLVFRLHMNQTPLILNGESWGLGNDRLPEVKIVS